MPASRRQGEPADHRDGRRQGRRQQRRSCSPRAPATVLDPLASSGKLSRSCPRPRQGLDNRNAAPDFTQALTANGGKVDGGARRQRRHRQRGHRGPEEQRPRRSRRRHRSGRRCRRVCRTSSTGTEHDGLQGREEGVRGSRCWRSPSSRARPRHRQVSRLSRSTTRRRRATRSRRPAHTSGHHQGQRQRRRQGRSADAGPVCKGIESLRVGRGQVAADPVVSPGAGGRAG